MSTKTNDEKTALSDRVVSLLRTGVPAAWGVAVTWLLGLLAPHLPGGAGTWLEGVLRSPETITFVVGLSTLGWYALWRWLEPRLSLTLTRLVLGSARTPGYPLTPVEDGEEVAAAALSDEERERLARIADVLSEHDPARGVLQRLLES